MDIVGFLAARLDEDQASAEAWDEAERTWQQVGARNLRYDNGSGERVQSIDTGGGQGLLNEQIWVKRDYDGERTAHIARHDPARVLAEVAAKRAILAEHTHGEAVQQDDNQKHDFGCHTCHADTHCGETMGYGWCQTVRLMDAVYADHPDFGPAWRVE